MNIERTHDEIAELLGVYALDAVDDDERAAVEAHLQTCPRCAAEVAEHREVAAQLANDGGAAPDGVWQRIFDSLEETPPPFELVRPRGGAGTGPTPATVTSLAERRSLRTWLPLSAAAAVLVVVGLVAGVVVGDRGDGSRRSMEEIVAAALDDPDAATVPLRSADDGIEALAVVQPDGSGFLMGDDLPELDESQTYQLWGIRDGTAISLGILGSSPDVVAFHADGPIEALAVTAEAAGGVERSANDPVVVGELS